MAAAVLWGGGAYAELFALRGEVAELGRLLGLADGLVDVVGDLLGRLERVRQVVVVRMRLRRIAEQVLYITKTVRRVRWVVRVSVCGGARVVCALAVAHLDEEVVARQPLDGGDQERLNRQILTFGLDRLRVGRWVDGVNTVRCTCARVRHAAWAYARRERR